LPKGKGKKMGQTPRRISYRWMDRIQTHRYSLSVTTPTVDYSDKAKWILDTGATYHVCPNMAWFSSFEKLDGCYTVMGDVIV